MSNSPSQKLEKHFVLGTSLDGELAENLESAVFGLGCFWGAERKFWQAKGVHTTSVGYTAGQTLDPSYEEVCSGKSGHNEVVRVIFDPTKISYLELLQIFWENHDPTQGMRQGNDVGTQYRSGIYTKSVRQKRLAKVSSAFFQLELHKNGRGNITTEILPIETFYFAENYHQQYLAKNPNGYCGLGGIDIHFPIDLLQEPKRTS